MALRVKKHSVVQCLDLLLQAAVLPQELGERSSHPQEYSLAYFVWLGTPTPNLALATNRALSARALFHGCNSLGEMALIVAVLCHA